MFAYQLSTLAATTSRTPTPFADMASDSFLCQERGERNKAPAEANLEIDSSEAAEKNWLVLACADQRKFGFLSPGLVGLGIRQDFGRGICTLAQGLQLSGMLLLQLVEPQASWHSRLRVLLRQRLQRA